MGTLRDLNQQGAKDYNNGDLDAMAEAYSRDAVFVSPDGRFEGVDAIRKQWADQMAAFPGAQIEYTREVEEGDTIVTEFIFRGTNTGPLALPDGSELPATGKAVELEGVVIAKVVGGKVVSETMYYDNMKAYGDLGLLPS
jgi:ketosteroid isomerase-like protein